MDGRTDRVFSIYTKLCLQGYNTLKNDIRPKELGARDTKVLLDKNGGM